MNPPLYDRRARVSINDLLFEGDHQESGRIVQGFRITFQILQALFSVEDTAECEVYNLSETSRGQAAKPGASFTIEAGYEGSIGTIFRGQCRKVVSERQPTGFVTKMNALDGFQARRVTNLALAPGTRVAEAIAAIAKAMGVDARRALQEIATGKFDRSFEVYSNGLSLTGTARDEMDKMSRTHGFDWSIVNGQLVIQLPREGSAETAILLSPETGLIGGPARTLDVKRGRRVIVKAKALLQPGLRPGRRVELRSHDISGSYKVYNVTHKGDTDGSDWYSECDLLEVR